MLARPSRHTLGSNRDFGAMRSAGVDLGQRFNASTRRSPKSIESVSGELVSSWVLWQRATPTDAGARRKSNWQDDENIHIEAGVAIGFFERRQQPHGNSSSRGGVKLTRRD
jgi:hypothetical protein